MNTTGYNVSTKSKTLAIFAGHDEVFHHIVPVKRAKPDSKADQLAGRQLSRKAKAKAIQQLLYACSDDEGDEEYDELMYGSATPKKSYALDADGNDLLGKDIFGFKTPRKHRALTSRAGSIIGSPGRASPGRPVQEEESAVTLKAVLKKSIAVIPGSQVDTMDKNSEQVDVQSSEGVKSAKRTVAVVCTLDKASPIGSPIGVVPIGTKATVRKSVRRSLVMTNKENVDLAAGSPSKTITDKVKQLSLGDDKIEDFNANVVTEPASSPPRTGSRLRSGTPKKVNVEDEAGVNQKIGQSAEMRSPPGTPTSRRAKNERKVCPSESDAFISPTGAGSRLRSSTPRSAKVNHEEAERTGTPRKANLDIDQLEKFRSPPSTPKSKRTNSEQKIGQSGSVGSPPSTLKSKKTNGEQTSSQSGSVGSQPRTPKSRKVHTELEREEWSPTSSVAPGARTPRPRKAKVLDAGPSTPTKAQPTTPKSSRVVSQPGTPTTSKVKGDSGTPTTSKVKGHPGTPTNSKVKGDSDRTPRSSRRRLKNDDAVDASEVQQYFDSTAPVTSDHTLSRLNTPRLSQEELLHTLKNSPQEYEAERLSLMNKNRQNFERFMYLLCNNFNIVLHGLGSKRMLLAEFRKSYLQDFTCIVVNGYQPSISIKTVLSLITKDILDHSGSFRSNIDHVEFIKKQCQHSDYGDVFLVIHNIDGPMLRQDKTQAIISQLAAVKGFHIIASIDHINAPLMWDQSKASLLNFLWFDCTTYEPYLDEILYENSLMVQQTDNSGLALSSLLHVFCTLTPNGQKILKLLVNNQIQGNKDYQGISFGDLYQKCREEFLVSSEDSLKAQLTEFKDHKIVKTKAGFDGIEYLIIPLDISTLKEFLTRCDEE